MLKDRTVLITGSTDGIGKETAYKLSKLGAEVIVHGRNQDKAKRTEKEIKENNSQAKISSISADLTSFDQIRNMVNEIKRTHENLSILINNAGVFKQDRTLTKEGLEETIAVNYLAPFLLTNLLVELLKKNIGSRIVNVASQVHSNNLDLNNFQFNNIYTGVKAYAFSKTCLIMFTYLLAEKLRNTDVTVNCLHPGIINTKLLNTAMGLVGASVSVGAEAIIYLATAPELERVSGKYFVNNRQEPSKQITYDRDLQRRLWNQAEKIIGIKFQ